MSKQLYYETVFSGLVPVKDPHLVPYLCHPVEERRMAVKAIVCNDHGPYKAGESVTFPPRHLVEKTGRVRAGHILVRTVSISDKATT